MENNFTQVVIIGCGPAGASTSIFLSKLNIPHVVLDKETFPRDKICGDACSGKTSFVLRKANPAILNTLFADEKSFLPSHGIVFSAPNGKSIDVPFPKNELIGSQPIGFIARRLIFDNFLFEYAKSPWATIHQQATITDIDKIENGYRITYKDTGSETKIIHCALLIGADGDKGITRKKLLKDNQVSKSSAIGLRAYYKGVTGLHTENFLELHFLKEVLPGYLWIFPLPNGDANIGIGINAAVARKKKINLRNVMLNAIAENPQIKDRFKNAVLTDKIYGWGLPTGESKTAVSGDNFLLTGDAASLVDPFTGEGIGNALYSGMLAAEVAAAAIAQNKFDAAFLHQQYDIVLFRRIGDELKLSLIMQKLVSYPWLMNLVINKANKSPSLQKTISSMFTNLDVRALLKKPSFYWNILFNK